MSQTLTSADFYSGVGGWSLGLEMAGIEVVRSYEHWAEANETNSRNHGHKVVQCDIRTLDVGGVPKTRVVVGSPPCTQFSLSNRGGSGDVSDGLKDIAAFLRVVQHVRPEWWVMENVPSAAPVVMKELGEGGALEKFRDLGASAKVFDMAAFGLPQRRRRCLIGNIDFELLQSYSERLSPCSLGEILKALSNDPVVDPLYGLVLPRATLVDHVPEHSLNAEEERINRAAKTLHPVYNGMHFPERLDRPARTITATCTRISRESIVVEAPERPGSYRRLTIRERAVAQGFPISFQFYGKSHARKVRMVGNAIPPLFAYYVGHAIRATKAQELPAPRITAGLRGIGLPAPPQTRPDRPSFQFPVGRRFRFAIPTLRMKSGMRFELTNGVSPAVDWHVQFVFGTSKNIRTLRPDAQTRDAIMRNIPEAARQCLVVHTRKLDFDLAGIDFKHMQSVWAHVGPGSTRPFMLLDLLDSYGEAIAADLQQLGPSGLSAVKAIIGSALPENSLLWRKLESKIPELIAGFIVAASVNARRRCDVDSVEPVQRFRSSGFNARP